MLSSKTKEKKEVLFALITMLVLILILKFFGFAPEKKRCIKILPAKYIPLVNGCVVDWGWEDEILSMEERMKEIIDGICSERKSYLSDFRLKHDNICPVEFSSCDEGVFYSFTFRIPRDLQESFSLEVKGRRLCLTLKKKVEVALGCSVLEVFKKASLPADADMGNVHPSFSNADGILNVRVGKLGQL